MTIIIADTTSGLPHELLEERGIPVIPQVVMFGEESYHDDKDFDTTGFLRKFKASRILPKTAAPEPEIIFLPGLVVGLNLALTSFQLAARAF